MGIHTTLGESQMSHAQRTVTVTFWRNFTDPQHFRATYFESHTTDTKQTNTTNKYNMAAAMRTMNMRSASAIRPTTSRRCVSVRAESGKSWMLAQPGKSKQPFRTFCRAALFEELGRTHANYVASMRYRATIWRSP